MKYSLMKQQGFSAIMAIVLVVLLALLGTTMATLTTTSFLNTTSSALEIQSWFAARSAIEWAVHTVVNCACGTNCCDSIDGAGTGTTINYSAGGLDGYQADFDGATSCIETEFTEGGTDYCVYQIDVLGSHDTAGALTYASRRINISVTDNTAP